MLAGTARRLQRRSRSCRMRPLETVPMPAGVDVRGGVERHRIAQDRHRAGRVQSAVATARAVLLRDAGTRAGRPRATRSAMARRSRPGALDALRARIARVGRRRLDRRGAERPARTLRRARTRAWRTRVAAFAARRTRRARRLLAEASRRTRRRCSRNQVPETSRSCGVRARAGRVRGAQLRRRHSAAASGRWSDAPMPAAFVERWMCGVSHGSVIRRRAPAAFVANPARRSRGSELGRGDGGQLSAIRRSGVRIRDSGPTSPRRRRSRSGARGAPESQSRILVSRSRPCVCVLLLSSLSDSPRCRRFVCGGAGAAVLLARQPHRVQPAGAVEPLSSRSSTS